MSLILSGTDGLSDVDGSAATPAIRGTDTNTGIFFPAADTIAFSEGGVEAMRIDSSANLQFNSGYGSVATAYACRAWVNFNGTGTVAIRARGNVSSITDNGTGDYTVNFTNAMPDANYSSLAGVQKDDGNNDANAYAQIGGYVGRSQTASVTYIKLLRVVGGGSFDSPAIYASIFR